MSDHHRVIVSDVQIVEAYLKVRDQITHVDAPTEDELSLVRRELPIHNKEMLGINWLRNMIVRLRKQGRLK